LSSFCSFLEKKNSKKVEKEQQKWGKKGLEKRKVKMG
jgi:hypothetical protein